MADWFNLSTAADDFVTETYNTSSDSTWTGAPTLTTTAAIKASILAAMAVASIIGNSVTIFLSKRKRQRTQPVSIQGTTSSLYTLLFQLAISDLLVSIWCISGEAAWTYTVEWKAGNFLCKTFKFAQVNLHFLIRFTIRKSKAELSTWNLTKASWNQSYIKSYYLGLHEVFFSSLLSCRKFSDTQQVLMGWISVLSWFVT